MLTGLGTHAQGTWTVCPQGPPHCPFVSIQRAIEVANSGDTIFIQLGTYNESLLIRKNLNLVGAWPNVVLIQGSRPGWPTVSLWTTEPGNIFGLIFKSDTPITVTLQNLQIAKAPWVSSDKQCADVGSNICPHGVAVKGRATVTLNNLWVHDNGDDGIRLALNAKATVQGCSIWANYDDGIHAWLGVEATIIGNSISENGVNGIKLQSKHQVTSWLTITGETRATIAQNHIGKNKGYGIEAQFSEEIVVRRSGPLRPAALE